jgi:fumarate hydratase subunit beta
MKKIEIPLQIDKLQKLKVGTEVLLSGTIYTARDQAHKRLMEAIRKGKKLPLDFKGAVIYYCGPNPAPPKKVIGSCGPTTSKRMDEFTIPLLERGLKAMIGKGSRLPEVIKAIKKYKAVYFLAFSGCGALMTKFVKDAKLVAYQELGCEGIFRLKVKDFPLIVGIDAKGKSIYKDFKKSGKKNGQVTV